MTAVKSKASNLPAEYVVQVSQVLENMARLPRQKTKYSNGELHKIRKWNFNKAMVLGCSL